ncbi:methyltransferase domain-containing protein [Calothrix sp. NIES-3974]|uniref:methyltransferase domain-containing protein n=1 Tax=Calothrix sp. NIES-3974 TaxID=2005462 RepID=UPI000B5DF8B6|nr:methyltransferase domain-containing protein [Calothrix sp. NIES-3974]BAZ07216.1 type 11 methyltransferase [Calothrix sp. NIES-3974]
MNNSLIKNYQEAIELKIEDLDENTSTKKMYNLIEPGKKVVDFGCATGCLAQLLIHKGCQVTGVEVNPAAAKIAEKYCEEVVVADLDFVSIPEILKDREFDIAVFGDVLEHLRNPWQILRDVKQVLKPGGYVVASIPNIAHGAVRLALLQGRFEYVEYGILDNTHLRFFTRASVESLFEDSGYIIHEMERTTKPIFFTEGILLVPDVKQNDFPPDLVQEIQASPESETLQFVIKAVPETIEGRYQQLRQRYSALSTELEQTKSQLQQTQIELERSQLTIQQQQSNFDVLNSQLQQTQAELNQSQIELQQTQAELNQSQIELQQTQAELNQSQIELQQIQTDVQTHITKILAMQSSKFWKLRNFWFSIKQLMGIKAND